MLTNAASALPFVLVFTFMWFRLRSGRIDALFWSACALFVAGSVFGLWWQAYRSRRMICPQCGAMLFRSGHPGRGQAMNFVCSHCDVEWITGLSVPDD